MPKEATRRRDPIKLVRRSGQWSLEFNRLIAVDDQVMRPERCHVAATTDVLRSLDPNCPPHRVRDAEAIMQQPDDGSERVFELGDDGWVPASPSMNSQRPLSRTEMMAVIGELQSQLTLMRGLHDALLTRVVSMEGALQAKAAKDAEQTSHTGRRVPSRRDMLAVLQRPETPGPLALDGLRAADAASPAHAATSVAETPPVKAAEARAEAPPEQPGRPAAAAPPPATPPAQAAVAAAKPSPGRLVLPTSAEVIECLQLLAADVVLTPAATIVPADFTDFYVARLIDASEEALGLILINQRAGAALGGGLLGLPLTAREDQSRRGIAKDTLEGLNEICNNLGGLVNRKNPKAYTKIRPLERVNATALPWVTNPAATLGITTPPNGVLWLLSR